ncbi:MAG: ABC transporter permease, partial [Clostridiales bacterium]|nr:ABC transporter permease [Clostridiales bacterium]
IMGAMIGLATVFIVLIVAWLINYMVRFMLEKRSSEFGIYLLLGMKKKTIARLYIRENMLLGGIAFLVGLFIGVLLEQVLLAILFALMRMEYHLNFRLNKWTILMTVLCYAGCYLLALFRCKRKFKKMNIHDLMNAKRQNEKIREKHEGAKKLLLPLSILFIIAFWMVFRLLTNVVQIAFFLIGLVITIYLFYIGISAWIICYVRKKKNGIYRGQNLFLLRQFASKVRTMQFTMGTLTALFTIALMGASIALMFTDYENTVLEQKFPFDVQVYSADAEEDFADAKEVLMGSADIKEIYEYSIYTDQGDQVNTWMLTNLRAFGNIYRNADGSPNEKKIEETLKNDGIYCWYDTYMGVSDYNHLRKMLGYEEISLDGNEYVVQIKERLEKEVQRIGEELKIADATGENLLKCAGIYSESFSQDGHNGGDYLIIVPDEVLARMQPYYSELAAELKETPPADLSENLNQAMNVDMDEGKYYGEMSREGNNCIGSDNIVSYTADVLVKEQVIPNVKYLLASLVIPLFYIGLVFLCVAVTVLSVQQLSDSAKYKFRYDVLAKLGVERTEINRLILKQLTAYYLCPALLAIIISGKMILQVSEIFVRETGVPTSAGMYFVASIALFFGIYLVYFIVTYIGFKRNVEGKYMTQRQC